MDEKAFLAQFKFQPEFAGAIGVEREYFLTDEHGTLKPRSPEFLMRCADPAWTYELSACQVEHRTAPARTPATIAEQLRRGQEHGKRVAQDLGLRLTVMEVAPEDMPLDVYPDDERYGQIVKTLPQPTLRAACQVTGTHLHRGVADIEEALLVHNRVIHRLDEFMALGDHSQGERLRLYRIMAKHWRPPFYESASHFHAVARDQGFEASPRDCWHLVRISRHGTVELRMFGMTESIDEIASWIRFLEQAVAA